MDNQDIYVGEEQQALQHTQHAQHAQYAQHKLQKQERRLLERLREAQEAEARALEQFERAKAKLERRKARIQRLTQRISQLKEASTDSLASTGEHFVEYGDYADYDEYGKPHDEHTANGYVAVETQAQDVLILPEPVTPIPTFEPAEPLEVEIEEDRFEPEVHVTPELSPLSEPSLEVETESAAPVDEDHAEPVEEVSQAPTTAEVESVEAPEPAQAVSVPEELASVVKPLDPIDQPLQEAQPAQEAQPVQAASLKALEQSLAEARDVWQMAEAHVKLAQERRDELAKSISFLAQANLSGALMDELLHKQAEANRFLVGAKEHERIANERLARAEAAYREAQA
jgi:hypothetical protein